MLLNNRLADTRAKKVLLYVTLVAILINAILSLRLGFSASMVLGGALVNALLLWLTLYNLTCLRNGKCVLYSNFLLAVTLFATATQLGFAGYLLSKA